MTEHESIYQELCGLYNNETIPRRIAYIKAKINFFLQSCDVEQFAIINENILCHLVLDYFADIVRLKKFHNINRTNKEKILAYTSYWLCRRKPIQFNCRRIDDGYTFINEAFVSAYITDEIMRMSGNKFFSDSLSGQLFYHLKYRILDSQSLELFIKSFVEASHSNNEQTSG